MTLPVLGAGRTQCRANIHQLCCSSWLRMSVLTRVLGVGRALQFGVALLACSMYLSAEANLGGNRALPFVVALLQLWQEVLGWSAPYRARYRAAKNVFDAWWEVRTERCALLKLHGATPGQLRSV